MEASTDKRAAIRGLTRPVQYWLKVDQADREQPLTTMRPVGPVGPQHRASALKSVLAVMEQVDHQAITVAAADRLLG